MKRITRSWKRLLIVLVVGLFAIFAARRISAGREDSAPSETSRRNAAHDGAPIPNDVGDFQQLD